MSLKKLIVIDIVGLSPSLLGEHTPNLNALAQQGFSRPLHGSFPGLTTSAQSNILTGKTPKDHGVVGNGWYFRELAEVAFWKQSNALVESDKVWDVLKRQHPEFRVSKLFWWYNMYANVDASITPRPHYLADGGKIFDLYSSPKGLHQGIEEKIGTFPFFSFWGPKAGIPASRWIVSAAIEEMQINRPHLQLVYLPHLDYCLQKFGPDDASIPEELKAIDAEAGRLIDFARSQNYGVLVVSEYGIEAVDTPVHINRILREQGWIEVRETGNFENLDAGASTAFAVADHQIAHVYVNQPEKVQDVAACLRRTEGIAHVLDEHGKREWGIDHHRAGDLVAIAAPGAWFTYYYWLDDARAPDFARTVDIHRKPGYDPCEMFIDPGIRFPTLKVASKLARKKAGMRMLMDLIPIDASLIKGSHGRLFEDPETGPIIIADEHFTPGQYHNTDVFELILSYFKRTD